jgi:abhydrolase domain-containing protein 6
MKRFLIVVAVIIVTAVAGLALWINFAPPSQVLNVAAALERDRAGLVAKVVTVQGLRIAYLDGGAGEPIVLIHGFGAEKDNWTPVARYLTKNFRVVAVDLPGFGDSDKPIDRDYRTSEQVKNLHAFAQTLGLTSFHVGGNSMGGRIAAEYAAAYPAEARSLWLLAPAGVISAQPSEMDQHLRQGKLLPLIVRTPAEFEQLLGWVMTAPPYIPGPVKQALAERAAANYDLHARIFDELWKEWQAAPLEGLVAGLRTPTRIVWGDKDRLLHISGATVLKQAIPNSSVLELPGIGHLPMMEAPQTVADDFIAFAKPARQ